MYILSEASFLFQISSYSKSWNSSLKHPSTTNACFLFHSYSKLIKFLSEASLHYQCIIQVLSKIDETPLWSIPTLPMYVSYSILVQIWWNPVWGISPLPMYVSYETRIQNWWKSSMKHPSSSNACFVFNVYSILMKTISEASLLYQCMFIVWFSIKTYGNPLWSIPPLPMHAAILIGVARPLLMLIDD